MSKTLDIASMVLDVQNRVPIGLTQAYIIDRLNESFRWIVQQESFVWNLRRELVTVDKDTIDFPLPDSVDVGDPMSLYGSKFQYEIPFIPFAQFSQQQVWTRPTPPDCPFSAWTIIAVGMPGVPYIGKLAPDIPLIASVALNLFFHMGVQRVSDPALFFPSPDEFDDVILDVTEANIKRRYNLFGWQDAQARGTESLKKLMDVYRTSKKTIQGMADQAMRTQEAALKRAE